MTWHELLRKQCQDRFPRKTPLKGNLRGQRCKDVGNVGELKQIKKKKKPVWLGKILDRDMRQRSDIKRQESHNKEYGLFFLFFFPQLVSGAQKQCHS